MALRARAEATSAGIYGTVTATALIASLSDGHVGSARKAFELLVVGQFAFFLAHTYSEYLAAKAGDGETLSLGDAAEVSVRVAGTVDPDTMHTP